MTSEGFALAAGSLQQQCLQDKGQMQVSEQVNYTRREDMEERRDKRREEQREGRRGGGREVGEEERREGRK